MAEPAPSLDGLAPVISPACRLVVLGSFPGVASLKAGHYYAHPRNLFWPIMSEVLELPFTEWPFEQRYEALNDAGIGLWDVIASCRRPGSLDSNIRDEQPAQLTSIRQMAPGVHGLLLNGKKAQSGARRGDWTDIRLFDLPSTSPANASVRSADKLMAWRDAIEQGLQ